MQDRKALQAGTSHFLGQNFAKAFDIKFQDDKGSIEHAWTTSWGVSTRLIGGMIMTHADDDGLVCPPRLAPAARRHPPGRSQKPEDRERVLDLLQGARAGARGADATRARRCACSVDDRDMRGGDKAWQWIKKGVPIRLEIGPRDIDKDSVFMGRRDKGPKEKVGDAARRVRREGRRRCSQEIQDALYARALAFRERAHADDRHQGRVLRVLRRAEDQEAERSDADPRRVRDDALQRRPGARGEDQGRPQVTVRCIPLAPGEPGTCPFTGQPSAKRVVWAKAY